MVNLASGASAVTALVNRRNADYVGGGDMITGFLDAGGGVALFMAAVGALAVSGAGIGLAITVTEAVATGGAVGSGTVTTTGMIADAATVATTAGEAAAQTVAAAQASSMTAAQVAAEINALTMTTALDAAAVNAAAQAGIITAAEQVTLLQTVSTGAVDLASTAGRNLLQKAIEEKLKPWPADLPPTNPVNPQTLPPTVEPPVPPPVNVPMTAAEQAAKLLKDQAIKAATGAGGSAFIKALTGGAGQPQPNRNLPAYLQNQPQQLTNNSQSGSVFPIALVIAALTLLG